MGRESEGERIIVTSRSQGGLGRRGREEREKERRKKGKRSQTDG